VLCSPVNLEATFVSTQYTVNLSFRRMHPCILSRASSTRNNRADGITFAALTVGRSGAGSGPCTLQHPRSSEVLASPGVAELSRPRKGTLSYSDMYLPIRPTSYIIRSTAYATKRHVRTVIRAGLPSIPQSLSSCMYPSSRPRRSLFILSSTTHAPDTEPFFRG
jgi:hypothetical protein